MKKYDNKIYQLVSLIPAGKVATYGLLAGLADCKSSRLVGNILHKNTDPEVIPCHRVVNHKGRVAEKYAFGGSKVQREKLEREGICFKNDKIDLSIYLWNKKSMIQ